MAEQLSEKQKISFIFQIFLELLNKDAFSCSLREVRGIISFKSQLGGPAEKYVFWGEFNENDSPGVLRVDYFGKSSKGNTFSLSIAHTQFKKGWEVDESSSGLASTNSSSRYRNKQPEILESLFRTFRGFELMLKRVNPVGMPEMMPEWLPEEV